MCVRVEFQPHADETTTLQFSGDVCCRNAFRLNVAPDINLAFSQQLVLPQRLVVVDPYVQLGSVSTSREIERLIPFRSGGLVRWLCFVLLVAESYGSIWFCCRRLLNLLHPRPSPAGYRALQKQPQARMTMHRREGRRAG